MIYMSAGAAALCEDYGENRTLDHRRRQRRAGRIDGAVAAEDGMAGDR